MAKLIQESTPGVANQTSPVAGTTGYALPIASATILGGIKVGSGLVIDPVTGILTSFSGYTLPPATHSALGGVIVGANLTVTPEGLIDFTLTSNEVITALGFTPVDDATLAQANGVATLDSTGTVPLSQLPPSLIGAVVYKGTWDAATNVPTLTSSVGTKGNYYIVSNNGTTNLNGITTWNAGDWAIFNGTTWNRVDNGSAVVSVFGRTGAVVMVSTDVTAALGYTPYNNTNPAGYLNTATLPVASTLAPGVIRVGTAFTITNGVLNYTNPNPTPYVLPTATNVALGGVKVDGTTVTITNGVISAAGTYSLPTASTVMLGGVKIDGSTITITNGVISGTGVYVLPEATSFSLGGIKVGAGLSMSSGVLNATPYNLPTASSTVLGGVKIGTTLGIVNGVLDYTNPNPVPYVLNIANAAALGGIKVGANLTINSVSGILDYVNPNPTPYTLPTATNAIKGGMIAGPNMAIAANGMIDYSNPNPTPYTLPVANGLTLGGIKIGSTLTLNGANQLDYINPNPTPYVLPTATGASKGGVIAGLTMSIAVNGMIDYNNPNPTPYSLPVATPATLGGVIVGNNLTVATNGMLDGVATPLHPATNAVLGGVIVGDGLAVAVNGLVTANAHTLPIANASTLGGVKTGANVTVNSTTGVIDYSNPNPTPYSLPTATNAIKGGVIVGDGLAVAVNGVLTANAPTPYSLPTATNVIKGGVIVGNNLTVAANGMLDASAPYSLPIAAAAVLGGVKVGNNLTINATTGVLDAHDSYSLPVASSSVLGGIKIGSTLTLNASNQLDYVNPNPTPYSLTAAGINAALGYPPANANTLGVANGIATLGANGQLVAGQIPSSLLGSVIYQGAWNASTNTPALASGVGTKGNYYIVSVAGSTSLNGISNWTAGDWAIFDGTAWGKVDAVEAVQSVFGRTGAVVMSSSDVTNALTFTPYNATNPNSFINVAGLPIATASAVGVIKVGNNLTVASNGMVDAAAPYSLPAASTTVLGGVKVDGTTIVINATTNVISGANTYTLPTATTSVKGGVIVGNNLTVAANGMLDAGAPYTLPTAAAAVLGGVKVGNNLTINASTGVLDAQNSYSLPVASSTVLGGIKIGSTLTLNASNQLDYVNPNPTPYSLPVATASVVGGVKVGNGLTVAANGMLDATATGASLTNTYVGVGNAAGGLAGTADHTFTQAKFYANSAIIALGNTALAAGVNSISLGTAANAAGASGIAIGKAAIANQINSLAIGISSIAGGGGDAGQVALGAAANAFGLNSTALGSGSHAQGSDSVAIGRTAFAGSSNGVAIGVNSYACEYTVAIGINTNCLTTFGTAGGSVIIGAQAFGGGSFIIGGNAPVVAIGQLANANATNAVAIGPTANTSGGNSVVIGLTAKSTGADSVAIGALANAQAAVNAIAIGRQASTKGTSSIAIGAGSLANNAVNGIAIGTGSVVNAVNAVAIGVGAQSSTAEMITLGVAASTVNIPGSLTIAGVAYAPYSLPTATTSVRGGVIVGNGLTVQANGMLDAAASYSLPAASTTVLGGVKVDGSTITINATTNVISATPGAAYPLTNTWIGLGGANGLITGSANLTFTPDLFFVNATRIILGSETSGGLVNGTTVIGSDVTINGGMAIGQGIRMNGTASIVFGQEITSDYGTSNENTGLGRIIDFVGSVERAVAIGMSISVAGTDSIAIGSGSVLTTYYANYGIAIGAGSAAGSHTGPGWGAIALGVLSYSIGNSSIAIGPPYSAADIYGSATNATGNHSMALGSNAKATANDAVAIGTNALSSTANMTTLGTSVTTVNVPGALKVNAASVIHPGASYLGMASGSGVINTTAQQSLLTQNVGTFVGNLPAYISGRGIRIEAQGQIKIAADGTGLSLTAKVGTNNSVGGTLTLTGIGTSYRAFTLVITAVPSSADATMMYFNINLTMQGAPPLVVMSGALDTGTSNTFTGSLDLTAQWGSASNNNSISVQTCKFDII